MSAAASKLSTHADIASSEAQTLVAEIRKALGTMKSLAVDYERDGKSDKANEREHFPLQSHEIPFPPLLETLEPTTARVFFFQVQKLEETVLEIVASYEDCAAFAEAIKAVPAAYQPSDQTTDFKWLIETEVNKVKGGSTASGQNHPLFRQFRESVWNVHHAGQPMPGEEQEDIVMTSTQMSILNVTCPLTGKPVVELANPVRCVDCRHIYEKDAITHYIRSQKPAKCPIAGCPRVLQIGKVVCDPLLLVEIEEMRSSEPVAPNATNIEDFTDLLDEDEDD